jgi:prephenate dehydratase
MRSNESKVPATPEWRVRPQLATIAYQGEPGAFSEQAAYRLLGRQAHLVPCATFAALFAQLTAGQVAAGLVPVENSLVGPLPSGDGISARGNLRVIAEIVEAIHHHLIGCMGSRLAGLAAVASHPAALAQCRRFFAVRPGLRQEESDDTAASVRRVCQEGDPERAAIGSARAARLYGGRILRRNVQDAPDNRTRFVLLAAAPVTTDGRQAAGGAS